MEGGLLELSLGSSLPLGTITKPVSSSGLPWGDEDWGVVLSPWVRWGVAFSPGVDWGVNFWDVVVSRSDAACGVPLSPGVRWGVAFSPVAVWGVSPSPGANWGLGIFSKGAVASPPSVPSPGECHWGRLTSWGFKSSAIPFMSSDLSCDLIVTSVQPDSSVKVTCTPSPPSCMSWGGLGGARGLEERVSGWVI